MPKKVHFWQIFENLTLVRSFFIGRSKTGKFKYATFWVILKHCDCDDDVMMIELDI